MEIESIIRQIAISVVPILLAVVFHELSHGLVAYKLGDPTAKMLGRLTLNPIAHIDIIGTLILPLTLYVMTNGQFVFGYAKPVPINPANFSNPRTGMAISAAAGPIVNLCLALISVLILKYVVLPFSMLAPDGITDQLLEPIKLMLKASIIINTVLAVFNMLPVPPLDGGRVLAGFLPYKFGVIFDRLEPYGMLIVLFMVITGITNLVIYPIVKIIVKILTLL